jgi:hypothetical protein
MQMPEGETGQRAAEELHLAHHGAGRRAVHRQLVLLTRRGEVSDFSLPPPFPDLIPL